MAINPNALVLPARGLVFTGAVDAAPPAQSALAAITAAAPPVGWTCIGHTSRENLPAYSKDGGDVSQIGSWEDEALAAVNEPTAWSLTINPLQVADPNVLGLAFGGGTLDDDAGTYDVGSSTATSKALLLLLIGATRRVGIYHPNTSITIGDAPELSVEYFFELQLLAQLLSSPTTGKWLRFISPELVAPAGP